MVEHIVLQDGKTELMRMLAQYIAQMKRQSDCQISRL
jgi:hypothetical protein